MITKQRLQAVYLRQSRKYAWSTCLAVRGGNAYQNPIGVRTARKECFLSTVLQPTVGFRAVCFIEE